MSDFLNTIKSTAAGRARLDFFDNLPETPSPRILWMRKHDVKVVPEVWDEFNDRERWAAYTGLIDDLPELHFGDTADDAIVEFAKKNNLKLWNES